MNISRNQILLEALAGTFPSSCVQQTFQKGADRRRHTPHCVQHIEVFWCWEGHC
jgi:hypothetical protein